MKKLYDYLRPKSIIEPIEMSARRQSISYRKSYSSQNDSIYGITNPKQLIINDIRCGKSISINMLDYISTNLNETDKFELLLEMNSMLCMSYNLSIKK